MLFQFQMAGVVISGVIVGVFHLLALSTTLQLTALLLLDLILIVLTVLFPPQRITLHSVEINHHASAHPKSKRMWFGFVLCVLASMFVGSNMVEMGPVIIKQAFHVDLANSSLGMAVAALITLIALAPAGRWMEKHGSPTLWLSTVFINALVGVSIWLMFGHDIKAFLPLSLVLISIVNGAWNDISIAALADELSPYRGSCR
ncbi:hypothetical protein [Vibrio sp. 10N.261.51.F12]|uniref:hypothetical protein n=1 Tax=Vibrio sp. 10N.261.51.F12 TaxID=3229679 RepID=UPI00354DF7FA